MTDFEPPSLRTTLIATGISLVVAAVVLVGAVLPAEYGIDPTGLGAAMGLAALSAPPDDVEVAEENATSLYVFQGGFRVEESLVLDASDAVRAGKGRIVHEVPVQESNVTRLRVVASWTDEPGTEAEFLDVQVFGPGAEASHLVAGRNDESGVGRLETELSVAAIPFPQSTPNGTLLSDAGPSDAGTGNWTIRVRLLEAGGDGPVGDESVVRVQAWATRYEATRSESATPGDRVTLHLDPHSAVEYKFRMDAGARLSYDWTSTASLFFDLHGDQGTEDSVTIFTSGTGTGESGVHEAPFAGRHGWYWRNDGSEAVTVVLETRGEYELLGVP